MHRVKQARSTSYHLTDCGHELADVCLTLGVWGARWREVLPEHHDPYLVLWTTSRLLDPGTLPRQRVVVRFDLTEGASPTRRRHDRYRPPLGRPGAHPLGTPEPVRRRRAAGTSRATG